MAAQEQQQTSKSKCLQCIHDDVIDDEDWFATKPADYIAFWKSPFDEFRNIKSKNWGAIDEVCEEFSGMVQDCHTDGVHPHSIFSAEETAELLTSLLTAGLRNERYLSAVIHLVYTCITRSWKYHHQMYKARRFWFMLFERILLLPDRVFLESVTVFLTVVSAAFTEKTKQLCCGPYMIVVDEFLYLDGSFHHNKMFPIFKKLYELQGKTMLDDYEFTYDRIVSPLFAPAVAQKEWYSLKDSHPVDLVALFTRLSLTRPVMIDLFLLLDPGIPILMELLANKLCQRMHSPLLFSIDALMSIDTTDSRFELLRKLLDQLDYPLILKFAVYDDVNYRRALAQKIIIHTLRFLDLAQKSGFSFQQPCKEDLIKVEFSRLKHMITKGGLDDKIFSFIIATERVEGEKEAIIKEKFQDYAICVLKAFTTSMSKCNKDTKDQLISCALNLLVAIGPLEEKECPSMFTNNTVEVLAKFYNYDERDIRLLSRVNTVNICQTSFDKKLELFRLVPIQTWGEEIYELYRNRRNMNKNLYSQLIPVTVKLIHYDLCILYHMKSSGVLEELNGERMQLFRSLKPDTFRNMCVYVNGENWTKMLDYVKADGLNKETSKIPQSVADKMMEVLIATVSDKSMPDRYSTIAVACMAHIMHHDELDVSKHITRSLISTVSEMYHDEANCFYLSDGGDFKSALTKKQFSKLGFNDLIKKYDKQTVKGPRDKKLVEALQSSLKIAETFSACKKETQGNGTKSKSKSGTKTRAIISIIPNPKKKSADCLGCHGVAKEDPIKEKSEPKIIKIENKEEDREKAKKPKKIKTCALSSCPRSKSGGEGATSESAQRRFKKCGRCRSVTYCGKECQAKDWSEHKKHCKAL